MSNPKVILPEVGDKVEFNTLVNGKVTRIKAVVIETVKGFPSVRVRWTEEIRKGLEITQMIAVEAIIKEGK